MNVGLACNVVLLEGTAVHNPSVADRRSSGAETSELSLSTDGLTY